MEVHFVHATNNTATAQYLVVGVMFNAGADNAVVETMLGQNPGDECIRDRPDTTVNLGSLLPANRSHYHYNPGSLTTPPCTEGVLWMVLKQPVQVSEQQIAIFSRMYPMNARPLQAASGRMIKESN